MNTILSQETGEAWTAFHGDCIEAMKDLPDGSIDFSVYSPPFSSLYIYSGSARDMGNVASDQEFQETYFHAVSEKFRVTRPGRLTAIHVKDLVYYSNASAKGDRGLRDFSGDCIRTHIAAGWTYHSRITVPRCPVREMTKSKPDGLLYKNFRTDAARNRAGLPEYIVTFRKWADGMDRTAPIVHVPEDWLTWAGDEAESHPHSGDHYRDALQVWQEWAAPVWPDLPETDVLNAKSARGDDDEKHLCPMPLNLSERAIRLWSNEGDVVLSPFMGIGSEGWSALKARRRFAGIELKDSYFTQAVKNLREAQTRFAAGTLFEREAAE